MSPSTKLCFNSNCGKLLERSRKGWRRRTGEYADLCDRCASAYEEGKFCETFHLDASGWRCCESCGKRIHCGCIVSFHMFVLLDAGGIECITCARKSFILTPNPAWPPPSILLPVPSEKTTDLSAKNWGPVPGSGHVPWRQAPSLFNTASSFNAASAQSELKPSLPFEADIPGGIDRLLISERLCGFSLEKNKKEDSFEKLVNGSLKISSSQIRQNGNVGINCEEKPTSSLTVSKVPSLSKNDSSTAYLSTSVITKAIVQTSDQTKASGSQAEKPVSSQFGKQFCSHNRVESSGENQSRNGRPRDARGRYQLLPRYWPRITDQELQQISGDSNSVITPLFEKMLSASDAGRIGRLVLPKKCAEAYFPPISQPEGLPLKVQDLKGKEWLFQFRFWPNNNSRMYVLEGITPCIQSMELQAGDVVTFSRIEPEGKLVMGYRKATTAPQSDQGDEAANTGNAATAHRDADIANLPNTLSEADKSVYTAKEVLDFKLSFPNKRKSSTLGSKIKRLRIENKDMIELKLTWDQAQGLLRPPPNHVPTVVVIEGFEFEEYEQDAPIIGRPTIFSTDHVGEKIQWAQCEECFKWRKVPADALLPSRWTCCKNFWDPARSLCSVSEELTLEQLEGIVPLTNNAASKKIKAEKQDRESVDALGLDTLANLAIQDDGEVLSASSQATTKHPRHKPGCRCVVCVQPPSGKGTKHKQSCDCDVCKMVKQRFITMKAKREKKQLEKDAETARQKLLQQDSPEQMQTDDVDLCGVSGHSSPNQKIVSDEGYESDSKSRISFNLKGKIDLNIQPEREEELSAGSDSGDMIRFVPCSKEKNVKQHSIPITDGAIISISNQIQLNENGVGNLSYSNAQSHQDTDTVLCHVISPENTVASTLLTDR